MFDRWFKQNYEALIKKNRMKTGTDGPITPEEDMAVLIKLRKHTMLMKGTSIIGVVTFVLIILTFCFSDDLSKDWFWVYAVNSSINLFLLVIYSMHYKRIKQIIVSRQAQMLGK